MLIKNLQQVGNKTNSIGFVLPAISGTLLTVVGFCDGGTPKVTGAGKIWANDCGVVWAPVTPAMGSQVVTVAAPSGYTMYAAFLREWGTVSQFSDCSGLGTVACPANGLVYGYATAPSFCDPASFPAYSISSVRLAPNQTYGNIWFADGYLTPSNEGVFNVFFGQLASASILAFQ